MKHALILCLCFIAFSCNKKKSEVENLPQESVKDSLTIEATISSTQATANDVYFKATGTEPFWSLTISEKMIKFRTPEDSVLTPHTEPIKAADSNVKLYKLQTESAEMNIQINHVECTDAMSGMAFPYTVSVEYKKGMNPEFTKVKGCGQYITDYRLHDIWLLESLDGKNVPQEDFGKELPSIEINSNSNSFNGSTGCNRMNGQLFYEHGNLRFTNIVSTKMLCMNGVEKEQEFLKALQSCYLYSIENNKLTLSTSEKTLLIFKKID